MYNETKKIKNSSYTVANKALLIVAYAAEM